MSTIKALKYQRWAVVWTVVILVLCNIKISAGGHGSLLFENFDKLAHLGFFYVLTILLFYGKIKFQNSYRFRSLTIFKIVLINAVIGGAVELLQWKVFTYRGAEWWDFFCDMLGAAMGVFSYILLHSLHYEKKV